MARKKKETTGGGFSDFERNHITLLKSVIETELTKANALITPNTVFAGGWFANMLRGEPVRDLDFFIIDVAEAKNFYLPLMASKKTNMNYINNRNIIEVYQHNIKNQYMVTKYKTREELINDFDFEHCKVSYYQGKLYISPKTYRAIMQKELIRTTSTVNTPTVERIDKFLKQGYKFISSPTQAETSTIQID